MLCSACQEADAIDHRLCGHVYCSRCSEAIGPDCRGSYCAIIGGQQVLLKVSDYETRYARLKAKTAEIELTEIRKLSQFDDETDSTLEKQRAAFEEQRLRFLSQRSLLREGMEAASASTLEAAGSELKTLIALMTLAQTAEELQQEGKSVPGITDVATKRVYRLSELNLDNPNYLYDRSYLSLRIVTNDDGDFGILRDGQVTVYTKPPGRSNNVILFNPAVWRDCSKDYTICGVGRQIMAFVDLRGKLVVLDERTGEYYESQLPMRIAAWIELVFTELCNKDRPYHDRFFPNEPVIQVGPHLYKVLAPDPVFILDDLEVSVQIRDRCWGITNLAYHNVIATIGRNLHNLRIPR